MNNIVNQMLKKYSIKSVQDETNALKEIIQEIVSCGLSRGRFFWLCSFLWWNGIENVLWIKSIFRRSWFRFIGEEWDVWFVTVFSLDWKWSRGIWFSSKSSCQRKNKENEYCIRICKRRFQRTLIAFLSGWKVKRNQFYEGDKN